MANKTMQQGRHFTSSPPARTQKVPIGEPSGAPTTGIKPSGSSMNQSQDSGGGIFNPVQKPKSNSLAAAKKVKFYGK